MNTAVAAHGERESLAQLKQSEFSHLSQFIYDICGIKMPPVKKTMLEARLQKRLRVYGMKSFREYMEYLFSPEGEASELIHMIDVVTTNKTDFFRESNHFDYLVATALPELDSMRQGGPRKSLRFWSAGCSTGEEPYTLAMVLSEYAAEHSGMDFRILATDICTKVLEKGKSGIYDIDRVVPVPMKYKKKYLLRSKDPQKELVRIVPELRARISFRRLNFMDSEFGIAEPMDVIFCRNVVIYFDRKTQECLLNKFYRHLVPGGYLFMGHSETLNGLDVPFSQVASTIYRKSL